MHFKRDSLELSLTSRKSSVCLGRDCNTALYIYIILCIRIAHDRLAVTKWLLAENKKIKGSGLVRITTPFISNNGVWHCTTINWLPFDVPVKWFIKSERSVSLDDLNDIFLPIPVKF